MKYLLLLSFVLMSYCGFSQYADLGTGALKNKIWWFNWSGFTFTNGAAKTFTTDDGMVVTITFTNVSGEIPFPYVMNTWWGSVLHLLYDFSDPTIQPAIYTNKTYTSTLLSMKITATRNGIPTPFNFVAADAEASSAVVEVTRLTTNGSNWTTLDFFRNSSQTSNPLQGCGTQTVQITDTHSGNPQSGQSPMLSTQAGANGELEIDTRFDKTAFGNMGIAFGIFASMDRGDLPASYGTAEHSILYTGANGCNYMPPFPTLSQVSTLKIGAIAGDADPVQYTDDNLNEFADEDGVSSFPNYNGSGTYHLDIPVENTTGANAYLSGWFDINSNGHFDIGESVVATIPNNATSASLQWIGLPAILPTGSTTGSGFRFRISSDLSAVQSATGFARDGEVEDYITTFTPPCFKSDTVIVSICEGQNYKGHTIAGIYKDTLFVLNGCDTIKIIKLAVKQLPEVSIAGNTAICTGESLILSPGTYSSYLWQDGSTQDHFVVKEAGVYSVKVTTSCGTKNAEVTITQKKCGNYFPNAFTPNGDNKNDLFKILDASDLQNYLLVIYNRWGEKVYETTDYLKGWDGTYYGQLCDQGNYVWYCKFNQSEAVADMKGNVMLIR